MITSLDNPKIRWMRSLLDARGRRREGCFQVEGVILVEDALAAAASPRLVLYDKAALEGSARGRRLLDRLLGAPREEVAPAVLRHVCDTVTPQGIAAAFAIPARPVTLPAGGLVVVLDGVRDPGNVGTILRSAEAAGCRAVLAAPDTADIFSPKVVRAAMGAHFRLALAADVAWPDLCDLVQGRAVQLAQARSDVAYFDFDWTQPAALVVGNETEGPRPDAQRCATGRVSIPMPGGMESLNAAVAASVIIFEAARQRQQASQKR